MLIKSADITTSLLPHGISKGEVTRNTEGFGFSQMYEMAVNVPKSRSQSLVNNEDSFLFQNNKLLEQDLRSRLGEKAARDMAKAKNKGYDQARCISEF